MDKLKALYARVVADLKTVVRNLPAIRKDVVSAATSAISVVAAIQILAPQVAGAHQALFATAAGLLSGLVSFLTRDDVIDDVNRISGL